MLSTVLAMAGEVVGGLSLERERHFAGPELDY